MPTERLEGESRWVRAGFIAWTLAVLCAIPAQAIWLPHGTLNDGQSTYHKLAAACWLLALLALGAFSLEERFSLARALAALARRGIAAFVLLELLLCAIDDPRVGIAALPGVGGPYRELRTRSGDIVLVRKAHAGSPLGFRSASPAPRSTASPRLLFLGDSYTEGSGAAAACNYPEVAQRTLAVRIGRPVEVLNAGVAGHGPQESAALLEYLIEQGYAFDAVVWSQFLENDVSDDLPGTQRRAIAGMPARLPDSLFLRAFHPLDSHLFWWLLALGRIAGTGPAASLALERGSAPCMLSPAPSSAPTPYLQGLVRRHLEANYAGVQAPPGLEPLRRAVAAMRARAAERGVPFVVVSFPDRVLADADLRAHLQIDLEDGRYDLQRPRALLAEQERAGALIDLQPVLAAEPGLYRDGDTHLSDLGNLRAGERVGARLAELLPAALAADGAGSGPHVRGSVAAGQANR